MGWRDDSGGWITVGCLLYAKVELAPSDFAMKSFYIA
jgi:hypothetical protein